MDYYPYLFVFMNYHPECGPSFQNKWDISGIFLFWSLGQGSNIKIQNSQWFSKVMSKFLIYFWEKPIWFFNYDFACWSHETFTLLWQPAEDCSFVQHCFPRETPTRFVGKECCGMLGEKGPETQPGSSFLQS